MIQYREPAVALAKATWPVPAATVWARGVDDPELRRAGRHGDRARDGRDEGEDLDVGRRVDRQPGDDLARDGAEVDGVAPRRYSARSGPSGSAGPAPASAARSAGWSSARGPPGFDGGGGGGGTAGGGGTGVGGTAGGRGGHAGDPLEGELEVVGADREDVVRRPGDGHDVAAARHDPAGGGDHAVAPVGRVAVGGERRASRRRRS